MKKAEYIKKYGTEAYIRKAYRPQYRTAALRKAGIIVPKPKRVKVQPKGLAEWRADVEWRRKFKDESYNRAVSNVHDMEKWVRRRRFHSYPIRVQRHIEQAYRRGKKEGKISSDRDLMEWVGKS